MTKHLTAAKIVSIAGDLTKDPINAQQVVENLLDEMNQEHREQVSLLENELLQCRQERDQLKRENAKMRGALNHCWQYSNDPSEVRFVSEQSLSTTAGSDLVTREEHEQKVGRLSEAVTLARELKERVTVLEAQLPAIVVERDQLRADKEKAEAAYCEACEHIDQLITVLPHEYEGAPRAGVAIAAREFLKSSDCGNGRVSKEELKPTIEVLKQIGKGFGRATPTGYEIVKEIDRLETLIGKDATPETPSGHQRGTEA